MRWLLLGTLAAYLVPLVGFLGSDALGAPIVRRLVASDAAASDGFGGDVSIYENRVLVGSQFDDDSGNSSGSAYLFDAASGSQLLKLVAPDAQAGDAFGRSVAISDKFALIGAPGDDDRGMNSGSAYLLDIATGQQLFKFSPTDLTSFDQLGTSVATRGDLAVIGAPAGPVYVFDTMTGAQLHKLQPLEQQPISDAFGSSVAIDNNRILIGAGADIDNGIGSGAAYVFDAVSGQQLMKLTASDAAESDTFGSSVALHGNLAVIGAPSKNSNGLVDAGVAYVFDITTGEELLRITPSLQRYNGQFGTSVEISEGLILVSALQGPTEPPTTISNRTYLFDAHTGQQRRHFTDSRTDSQYGNAVSIHHGIAVVGARLADIGRTNAGAAYVYIGIPEPSTAVLAAIGVGWLVAARKRRLAGLFSGE